MVASGARKEADTFRDDIASAKKEAADAVSKLADAEQRLADSTQREANAEARLAAIKTPRSIVNANALVASLKPFAGTEFTLNVFMDNESNEFTKIVAETLKEAGWIRKQPSGMNLGIPTMEIIFEAEGKAENVPACIDTGISIHISEPESLETLQKTPVPFLPKTLRAGLTLYNAIGSNITPSDEKNIVTGVINPKPAPEAFTICVGKKP